MQAEIIAPTIEKLLIPNIRGASEVSVAMAEMIEMDLFQSFLINMEITMIMSIMQVRIAVMRGPKSP